MFATVNKSSLFYQEKGATNPTAVIFIHGFPFNHEMWNEQLEIVGEKHRAISYDVRGHGKTDSGDGQYSIETHVDDLFELMSFLKIEKAVLVGLSMGGYIALRATERNPEKISGLVLCDTKSEADTSEGKIKRFQTMNELKTNGVSDAFTDGNLKNIFTPKSFETKQASVAMIRHAIKSISAINISANLLGMASRTDTTESLSKIKAPTLIMVGEKDPVTPIANSKSMHEKIKGSEMLVIPDASHLSNLENPTVFNDKLLQFLSNF